MSEPEPIDVLVLFYNSPGLVDPFVDAMEAVRTPLRLHVLDNGSSDDTPDRIGRRIADSRLSIRFHRSIRNRGFASGVGRLVEQSTGEFFALINSDALPEPDCFDQLLACARSDPRVGICDAGQLPEPHHKAVDPETGETTWCSGAAAVVRRSAYDAVGGFDDRLYFMYCEDIDLSWKMWMEGWKCLHVPGARVEHHHGASRSERPGQEGRRRREHYYSFRNSLFLHSRFRRGSQSVLPWKFLLKRFVSRRYSFRSKALFAIAFMDYIRYIPYLRRIRRTWGEPDHPWIRLDETSLAE